MNPVYKAADALETRLTQLEGLVMAMQATILEQGVELAALRQPVVEPDVESPTFTPTEEGYEL